MSIGGYVRKEVINKLLSNNKNVESVSQVLNELKKTEILPEQKFSNPYVYVNRPGEIAQINNFLEDDSQKLCLIGGIQGSGKSTLVRTTLSTCQEHVLLYWYECSQVTNLDDILLSLCAFFDKRFSKNKVLTKQKSTISIDERLISYLKTLDRPMVIVLDSIEYLVSTEFTIQDDELKQFFNYLLSQKLLKLILIGQRLPTADMDSVDDFINELRIAGLSEYNAINLLRKEGVNASNPMLLELYKYSRGYPWVLLLAVNTLKRFNMPVDKLLKELASYEDSFESFLIKRIYQQLKEKEKKILEYLSVIRHPVNIPAFVCLDNSLSKIENELEELQKIKMIRSTGKRFHVNTAVRKYVYNSISLDLKYKLHLEVSKFYAAEMSKNLADRTIRLSRKLLTSEQFFHNNTATKFYTAREQFEKKQIVAHSDLQIKSSKDGEIQLNQVDIKPIDPVLLQKGFKIDKIIDFEPEEVNTSDLDTSFQLPIPGKQNKELVNFDGLQIELTEEEKELLKETENTDQLEPPTQFLNKKILQNSLSEELNYKDTDSSPPEQISLPADEELFDLEYEIDTSNEEAILSNMDLVESLVFVARGYASENKHQIAIDRYREALEIAEKSNNLESMLGTLISMAESYMSLKQYNLSLECYSWCLKICEEIHDFSRVPLLLASMGKVYSECYQHEKALMQYNEVLKMPAGQLSNSVKAIVYLGIGEIYDYRQQFNEALNYYKMSLKAFVEINDLPNQAIIYSRIALIYDDLGRYEKAIENYEESLKIDKSLGKKQSYAATLSNLAAVCDDLGQRSRALKYYKQSLVIDNELNNMEGLYKTLSRVGTIYSEVGQTEKALNYYKQELKVAKKVKDPYWIAMAFLDLGDLFYYMNDYTKAAKHFFISQKVISKSISTDSKEKIERRINKLLDHIPRETLQEIKKQVFNK